MSLLLAQAVGSDLTRNLLAQQLADWNEQKVQVRVGLIVNIASSPKDNFDNIVRSITIVTREIKFHTYFYRYFIFTKAIYIYTNYIFRIIQADQFIEEERLKVVALLSGKLVWEASRTNINACENLDWIRCLAVHLWYVRCFFYNIMDVHKFLSANVWYRGFLNTAGLKSIFNIVFVCSLQVLLHANSHHIRCSLRV